MGKAKGKDTGHSFQDYMKRAVSPMLVLQLLSVRPMYAYQMVQELKARSGGSYAIFLYPVIYRLQSLGFVEESEKVISDNNRVRNYYAITPAGREHLKTLIKEYAQLSDVIKQIMLASSTGD